MTTRTLDPQQCYQVMQTRDHNFDGAFVVAVRTTRIYCRPSCPSRMPRFENVTFYTLPQAAEAAGFRACKRCKPQTADPVDPTAELARDICTYIDAAETIPTLEDLGAQFGYSPHYVQRAFKTVMGISPRDYAEARRAQRLKAELKAAKADGKQPTVTDALYNAGYGSSSRLYESAPETLGMTPATYREGGAGALIHYGFADSPLGRLMVGATERGVCSVGLGDQDAALLASLRAEYPAALIVFDEQAVKPYLEAIVGHLNGWQPRLDLPLDVRGTAFQARVWAALRAIPYGETRTYSQIAAEIGNPKAVRAVANACANNHAALVIPCHRVVREDGNMGGYKWGEARKIELLRREHAAEPQPE